MIVSTRILQKCACAGGAGKMTDWLIRRADQYYYSRWKDAGHGIQSTRKLGRKFDTAERRKAVNVDFLQSAVEQLVMVGLPPLLAAHLLSPPSPTLRPLLL